MQLFTDLTAAGLGPLEIIASILIMAVVSVIGSEMISPGNAPDLGEYISSTGAYLLSM